MADGADESAYMSEKFSSGTKNSKQTKTNKNFRLNHFMIHEVLQYVQI